VLDPAAHWGCDESYFLPARPAIQFSSISGEFDRSINA
jgi:hypothetical protein